MTKEGKITTYLAPPEADIPRNLSIPLVNEENFTLLKTEKPGLLRGPRRVFRLCVFALVIPSILITIPLYVRLVLYPPGHYPMMPTDQRLLNQHVSGIWCQAQSTHMNGSFNAFLSHGHPGVGRERRRHVMLHTMKMKDDVKEYWGFHFLQGSTITISSCTRWDGGQLMILRGIENLRRCAWIGEQDSFEDMGEDDDIISEERHRIKEKLMKEELEKNQPKEEGEEEGGGSRGQEESPQSSREGNQSEERRESIAQLLREAIKMSKDKKEILKILHSEGKIHDYIFHGQFIDKEFPLANETNNETSTMSTVATRDDLNDDDNNRTLSQPVNEEGENTKRILIKDALGELSHNGMSVSPKEAASKILKDATRRERRKRLRENRRKKKKGGRRRVENLTEEDLPQEEETNSRMKRFAEADGNDGAFEDLDTDDVMDILQDPKNDKRHEILSAEMTVGGQVFFPEGLKFERGRFNQTNLNDNSREEHRSSYSSSEEALASCEGVILTLPLVPYKNCHFRNMGINKIVYDIPITGTYYFVFNSDNEIYVNDFFFNLTMDRVVYDTNASEQVCSNSTDCSLPLSFWSDEQTVVEVPQEATWDHAYVLDTKCEPRVYVYLTLLLLVPLFIMCCAFR